VLVNNAGIGTLGPTAAHVPRATLNLAASSACDGIGSPAGSAPVSIWASRMSAICRNTGIGDRKLIVIWRPMAIMVAELPLLSRRIVGLAAPL